MTPWVTRLIIVNVVVYFLVPQAPAFLALRPEFLIPGAGQPFRPWTLVTYMFLHGGMFHLFFNMLGLFFFGPRLEAKLGSKNFLWLYFLSGFGGAALSAFTPTAYIIGASGAVFGVFLGFAMFWPREQIYIWGILPVQARWLVAIMTGLAVWGGVGQTQDGVAHFAHLGGFVGGFLYLRWIDYRAPSKVFKRKAYAHVPKTPGQEVNALERWRRVDPGDLHEINRDEFCRLMAKAEADGVSALTLDERAFMERFSAVG